MKKKMLNELLNKKISVGLVGGLLELTDEEIRNFNDNENREELLKIIAESSKNKKLEKSKTYTLNDNKFYM